MAGSGEERQLSNCLRVLTEQTDCRQCERGQTDEEEYCFSRRNHAATLRAVFAWNSEDTRKLQSAFLWS